MPNPLGLSGEPKNAGLNVTDLEANQELQDAVLSLHHCYMILLT